MDTAAAFSLAFASYLGPFTAVFVHLAKRSEGAQAYHMTIEVTRNGRRVMRRTETSSRCLCGLDTRVFTQQQKKYERFAAGLNY